MNLDFIAIGDTVVDEFIRLKDARVTCDINDEACTISMRWGDKIPFEFATNIAGVGNAANAAVAAARLGLGSSLIANIGDDRDGDDVITALSKEHMDTTHITRHAGMPTNHHYVLWFESERSILVKHELYSYVFPETLPAPKMLYLSSLGEIDTAYYTAIAAYLAAHPDVVLVFQPGTFQMKLGVTALAPIYARTNLFFCNKEEAGRILSLPTGTDIKELLMGIAALGPRTVVITDGRNGAYAYDGTRTFFVPMYPDNREPYERTGAGDAFASTVTSALALGKPLQEALLWGPINSMSVVQKIGAQEGLLTREALEQYLHDAPSEYAIKEL